MLAGASGIGVSAKGWEAVKGDAPVSKVVVKETEYEIKASSGFILVSTTQPIQIRVFTILGRLISNDTLPAGISRLQLPAHGVYIIKVGDTTCKVAV